MKRALLIGGSGFVSKAIARELLRAGHEVSAITRSGQGLPDGVRPLMADRNDETAFAKAAKSETTWDLVVDAIAFTRAHIRATLDNIGDRAAHLAVLSSDAVFNYEAPVFPKDEAYEVWTDHPYGRGKRDIEEELIGSGDSLSWTVLRPSHVYGPGSHLGIIPGHLRDPHLIERIERDEALYLAAGGLQLQMPVFVDDLAKMTVDSGNHASARREIFMALGPEIMEARHYYAVIGDILGKGVTVCDPAISTVMRGQDHFRFTVGNRLYSMEKARKAGLEVPKTDFRAGMALHVEDRLKLKARAN